MNHNDHERRRLAIVRALKGEPVEPYPAGPATAGAAAPERLRQLEREVADVRQNLRELSDRIHMRAQLHAVPDLGADPDVSEVAAPPVPPVERQSAMSKEAAKALFGY